MTAAGGRTIVVTGATGLQGGAVTRHLLKNGWHVRALTRNAASKPAQALTVHAWLRRQKAAREASR